MKYPRILILLVLLGTLLVLVACGGQPVAQNATDGPTVAAAETGHTETMTETMTMAGTPAADMGGEAMAGMDHGVPDEAQAVVNPVLATEASIAAGTLVFQTNCAVCHGESGHGDGPAAVGLDPKPANLGADHVQGNSDGALFYTITHGRTGTAMPAWESVLTEQQRWEVVNFVRTMKE